jgi:hypothetical protein
MNVTRAHGVGGLPRSLVALALVLVSLPVFVPAVVRTQPAAAQTIDLLEVSDSCVAIGQRIPNLTVWATGFEQWVAAEGTFLTVEWSWGGAPNPPDPATVNPMTQTTTAGSFTMNFDVTGVTTGFGAFSVIAHNALGARTLVGIADVDVQPTCPTGTASCSTAPGPGTLLVSTAGYDPSFAVQFFYQYHLPGQQGPVAGAAQPDGTVRAQFQPAPQSANARVTARVVQPAEGDSSERDFFITFAAPVCQDVRAGLTITPGTFDYGPVNVGSASAPAAFNVVNTGNQPTSIGGVSVVGADFGVDNNACAGATLAPNAGCAVIVHFAPQSAGQRSATLTATGSNATGASANLAGIGVAGTVTGTGARPPGLTIDPANTDFGSVPSHGSSAATVFTVTNTGSQPQTITSVALTGNQPGDFAVDPDTCSAATVAGGGTCTVKAAFQPTGGGARTARLVVRSNANRSATATLRGTGQVGQLVFDPNPADFGVVPVGLTSTPITVKISNSGSAPLAVSAVRTSAPDFLVSADTCTGQAVAAAASCTVQILFRPADAGERRATLDVDEQDGTFSGALHGVGIFRAILEFTPPVVSAGSLATVVGRSFPANTAVTLQWQENGVGPPIGVTTDASGGFSVSFVILVGERLGPRHLEPAPNPGVLDEPRPIAALLVQAPTFRPQGVAVRSGGFDPTLVSRG